MARLILKSPYLKCDGNSSVSGYLRYIGTRERVELLPDDRPPTRKQEQLVRKLVKDFPAAKELGEYLDYEAKPTKAHASAFITRALEENWSQVQQSDGYMKYIATRPRAERLGDHGLFSDEDGVNLEQAMRELDQYTGNVWTHILSLKREDAARLGYDNAKAWQNLLRANRNDIAAAMNIPPNHFRWYAAFHRKEHSVHIHLVVFSSDPKEGYLTRQGIQQVKAAFGRRIFQQDLIHVYEQKTEYRNTLGRDAERAMAELIAQMEQGQLQNDNLEQLVVELAEQLRNTKGKKVYGYLPPQTKALVDAIVDELARDERVASAYDLWNQIREEVCRTYSEQIPKRLPLSRQKEFKAVRNMVIREVLKLGQSKVPGQGEAEPISAPQDAPPTPPSAPSELHHGTPESTPSQHRQTQRAASHADAARCVLQLLHNMGRIFQEQSAADTIQAGLHIDKKRRRLLQEKRLALGHKADDHEDAVSMTTQRR